MINIKDRDIVVRIVQPAEKPEPPKREYVSQSLPTQKTDMMKICGLGALALFGFCLALGLLGIGFALKDIIMIVSLPLLVGIVTNYIIS
jgi:hypothetical protein